MIRTAICIVIKCKKYKSETEFDANNDKCNWFRKL